MSKQEIRKLWFQFLELCESDKKMHFLWRGASVSNKCPKYAYANICIFHLQIYTRHIPVFWEEYNDPEKLLSRCTNIRNDLCGESNTKKLFTGLPATF